MAHAARPFCASKSSKVALIALTTALRRANASPRPRTRHEQARPHPAFSGLARRIAIYASDGERLPLRARDAGCPYCALHQLHGHLFVLLGYYRSSPDATAIAPLIIVIPVLKTSRSSSNSTNAGGHSPSLKRISCRTSAPKLLYASR